MSSSKIIWKQTINNSKSIQNKLNAMVFLMDVFKRKLQQLNTLWAKFETHSFKIMSIIISLIYSYIINNLNDILIFLNSNTESQMLNAYSKTFKDKINIQLNNT